MEKYKVNIYADGKKIGSFPSSQKRSHRHLFNLAGVELFNSETGERIDKRRLFEESVKEKD